MFRLARSSAHHPFRVLGLGLIVAFVIVSLHGRVGGEFKATFRVPGVESQRANAVSQNRLDATPFNDHEKEPGNEMVGVAVAVIVLLIAAGSVIATGIPLCPVSARSGGRQALGGRWST